MKCPYCNSDMKLGQIEADNLLSWKPDGEKSIGGTRWAKSSNSIVLAKYYMFTPHLYCVMRNMVIIVQTLNRR